MDESSRGSRRIRREIDEPGLRASIVADVNLATSSSGGAESARQVISIRQGRSARATPAAKEEQQR